MNQQQSDYVQRPPINGYSGDEIGLPGVGGRFHPADDQGGYFWDMSGLPEPQVQTMGDYYRGTGSSNSGWYDSMMKILAMQSMDDVKQRVNEYLNLQNLWNKFSSLRGNQKTLKDSGSVGGDASGRI